VVGFTADVRSHKVEELERDPRVALTGLDAVAGVQLRLEGIAQVVLTPSSRTAAWRRLKAHSHVLFQSAVPPGSVVASPEDGRSSPEAPVLSGLEPVQDFALIHVHLQRIEWLDVSSQPHLRCQFLRQEVGWLGQWLAP
jgi:pyridoxamine 5'-phosphate oxidase